MPELMGPSRPFRTALWCVALSLGLPCVIVMFGMIRSRQLLSTANPRWAQFANNSSSTTGSSVRKPPVKLPKDQAQSNVVNGMTSQRPVLPSLELDDRDFDDSLSSVLPSTTFTGSVSGRNTFEVPVTSEPLPASVSESVRNRSESDSTDFEELPPIIFRPADDGDDQLEARTAELSRRLETQLAEVREQLSQLTTRQQELQAEERLRGHQFIDALTRLDERTASAVSELKTAQIPLPDEDPVEETHSPVPTFDDEPIPEPVKVPAPTPLPVATSSPEDPSIRIQRLFSDRPASHYSLEIDNADIRRVFAKLSEVTGINIVPSSEVQGMVSLNLRDVSFDTALNAIAKSWSCVIEREDQILIVRTKQELERLTAQNRKPVMKIYRPNFLNAAELTNLISPLLSSDGRHSISPAARSAIDPSGVNSDPPATGLRDVVVVQDSPEVLAQIDQLLVDVDLPPLQVAIEAKILCVRLSEGLQQGIDLNLLPCHQDIGSTCSEGGLKQGRLSCSVPTFIHSLERLADTSVVTSQRIQVLNNHRAEMLIGDRIGYQSQPGGDIRFLAAGTRLLLRPSISAEGYIRLEIHPERSSATIDKRTKTPVQNTTEMTTQVMIHDGATVAIGGLITEQVVETTKRIHRIGAVPILGIPFRHKGDRLQRTELIVLVTPRILVDCDAETEGQYLQQVSETRAAEFRDQRSPGGRDHLARAHYERACEYFQKGNVVKAHQHIHAALRENKADPEAIRLKEQIHQCLTPPSQN